MTAATERRIRHRAKLPAIMRKICTRWASIRREQWDLRGDEDPAKFLAELHHLSGSAWGSAASTNVPEITAGELDRIDGRALDATLDAIQILKMYDFDEVKTPEYERELILARRQAQAFLLHYVLDKVKVYRKAMALGISDRQFHADVVQFLTSVATPEARTALEMAQREIDPRRRSRVQW